MNAPGQAPIKAPLLIVQGAADTIVAPTVTEGLVRKLCQNGETVEFRLYPGVGHIATGHDAAPAVTAWIADRFDDKPAPTTCAMTTTTLSPDELELIDAYWRAANYLSVGQIYLLDNPLLREPLAAEHVKPRLLGHFGTTPGLNFIYAHLNRAIKARDLSAIYITGPGHGGPGLVANAYLEGTYAELYPAHLRRRGRTAALFRQFSFPGGIPSHVAPETPGSIHEGGELGYALSHAFGAAFDNPDLLVACVVGDGEAETGPLATSWHSNKFLNAATDGAVLPILHLNGYKIANPTVLARIPERELVALFEGYGWRPLIVSSELDEPPADAHERFAAALDEALDDIRAFQDAARSGGATRAPALADARSCARRRVGPARARSTACRSKAPGARTRCRCCGARENAGHRKILEDWMRSYRPRSCSTRRAGSEPELRALAPERRAAHERQPARERRRAPARISSCRTSATTPSRSSKPGTTSSRGDARARRSSCAT